MDNISLRAKGYIKAKQYAWQRHQNTHPSDRGSSRINVLRDFPLFRPNMLGNYKEKASFAAQSIRNTVPFLAHLSASAGHPPLQVMDCEAFAKDPQAARAAQSLKQLFDGYGSDKATLHNYHYLYGAILQKPDGVHSILEIGLGTNNEDVACNMGKGGKPGASIRSFRDFCENAIVYGADIDASILFQETRIQTLLVDQTNPASFEQLLPQLPQHFDLIIDDGLHAPDANILTLSYGLKLLAPGGWMVIEDILEEAQPVWQTVAGMLPSATFECFLISARKGMLFAVRRKA